jgi:hypothetical protein
VRCKIVSCIVLAQSKGRCGAVVNMVMNNRHPKKLEFCNKLSVHQLLKRIRGGMGYVKTQLSCSLLCCADEDSEISLKA